MTPTRPAVELLLALALVAHWSCTEAAESVPAAAAAGAETTPRFRYDPTWPKSPLPNEWILGEVGGIDVDARGHVW